MLSKVKQILSVFIGVGVIFTQTISASAANTNNLYVNNNQDVEMSGAEAKDNEPKVVDNGQDGNFTYDKLENGKAIITGYKGDGENTLDIPLTLNDKNGEVMGICAIGDSAFEGKKYLESVEFDSSCGIQKIGAKAFKDCTALKRIALPNSVSEFGNDMFCGCTALVNVNLPYNMKEIPYSMFFRCTSLTKIKLPSQLKIIGASAFYDTSLTTITNDNNNNDEIIAIPDSVEEIQASAFQCCKSLKQVYFGEKSKLKTIGAHAFSTCKLLSNINKIPSGVKTISEYAFEECNIEKFDIPSTVEVVEKYAFSECKNLKNVSFSEDVDVVDGKTIGTKEIDNGVFDSCNSLEKVIFPSTFEYTDEFFNGGNLFWDCTNSNLTVILKSLPKFKTVQDCEYGFDFSNVSNVILQDINEIPSDYLKDNTNIKSVAITGKLNSIGDDAFNGCTNLEKVSLPDSLATIGSNSFNKCTKLSKIYTNNTNTDSGKFIIPTSFDDKEKWENSMKSLFNDDVQDKKLVMPSSLTLIGESAFKDCTNLDFDINFKFPDMQLGNNWCAGTKYLQDIKDGEENYSSGFKYQIVKDKDNKTLGVNLEGYVGSTNVNEITIPASIDGLNVLKINKGFMSGINGFSNLKLNIGGYFDTIDEGAFENLKGLEEVNISPYINAIPESCFKDCKDLKKVNLVTYPEMTQCNGMVYLGAKKISANAFNGCESLFNFELPNTLEEIDSNAFANCPNIDKEEPKEGEKELKSKPLVIPSNTKIALDSFDSKTNLCSDNNENNVTHKIYYNLDSANGGACVTNYYCDPSDLEKGSAEEKILTIRGTINGNKVSVIYDNAFNNNLCDCTNVIVPESVVKINNGAFFNCGSLKKVKLLSPFTIIENDAFKNCNLDNIECGEWKYKINNNEANIIQYSGANKNFKIDDKINGLDITKILSRTEQKDGKDIIKGAFEDTGVTDITLGDKVNEIGKNAFKKSDLVNLIYNNNNKITIDPTAFDDTKYKENISKPKQDAPVSSTATPGSNQGQTGTQTSGSDQKPNPGQAGTQTPGNDQKPNPGQAGNQTQNQGQTQNQTTDQGGTNKATSGNTSDSHNVLVIIGLLFSSLIVKLSFLKKRKM